MNERCLPNSKCQIITTETKNGDRVNITWDYPGYSRWDIFIYQKTHNELRKKYQIVCYGYNDTLTALERFGVEGFV